MCDFKVPIENLMLIWGGWALEAPPAGKRAQISAPEQRWEGEDGVHIRGTLFLIILPCG